MHALASLLCVAHGLQCPRRPRDRNSDPPFPPQPRHLHRPLVPGHIMRMCSCALDCTWLCILHPQQEAMIAAGASTFQLLTHHDWANAATIARYERASAFQKVCAVHCVRVLHTTRAAESECLNDCRGTTAGQEGHTSGCSSTASGCSSAASAERARGSPEPRRAHCTKPWGDDDNGLHHTHQCYKRGGGCPTSTPSANPAPLGAATPSRGCGVATPNPRTGEGSGEHAPRGKRPRRRVVEASGTGEEEGACRIGVEWECGNGCGFVWEPGCVVVVGCESVCVAFFAIRLAA